MERKISRIKEFRDTFALTPWMIFSLFCGVLLPLVVLGKIADRVHDGDSFGFDDQILLFLHRTASPTRDAWIIHLTNLGRVQWMVPFCLIVTLGLFGKKLRYQAVFFALSSAGAAILNVAAKMFFGRDRPALWLSPATETDFGFPSGHAMVSMAVMAALVILLWPTKWRVPTTLFAVIFVVAIGLTRLYLGVHYPTDVLGGWCAALVWVGGLDTAIFARRRWKTRLEQLQQKVETSLHDQSVVL